MSKSSELIIVSALGALLGATATTLLTTKEGKKLRKNVEEKYHEIKGQLEETIDEETENVKETIDKVKEKLESVNLLEPKELAITAISFTLLGALLGTGATLMVQEARQQESLFDKTRPLLSDAVTLLNDYTGCNREKRTTNDLIDFALLGLKLWDRVKTKAK